jgi:lysophospholipase L1-like esterase
MDVSKLQAATERPSRRRRATIFRVVAVVGALALVAIVLEVALRLAGYNPVSELRAALPRGGARSVILRESDSPILRYELVPGANTHAWGSRVRINSAGFRDREYTESKPADTHRIVVIGDSITFGDHVDASESYPEQLETILRRDGTEVLNLGVGGYDTLQEVALLDRLGLAYDPDLVLVGFCINDVGIHSVNLRYIEGLQRYGSPVYASRLAQLLALRRDRHDQARYFEEANDEETFRRDHAGRISSLADDAQVLLLMRELRRLINRRNVDTIRHRFVEWYTSEARIGRLRFALGTLKRFRDEHGFSVAVLVVPHLHAHPYEDVYSVVYGIIRHEVVRQGFDVIEVHDEFDLEGYANLRLEGGSDLHPNAIGHRIIARKVRDYLAHKGWATPEHPPPG